MTNNIWLINGPNLNLLGEREPELYGYETLADIIQSCHALATDNGFNLLSFQSNHEGQLIDWLQQAQTEAEGIILNAAAYTHTSIAIQDALRCLTIPVIEVHLTNIWRRENIRHTSLVSSVVNGVIAGFGRTSYTLAIQALINILKIKTKV